MVTLRGSDMSRRTFVLAFPAAFGAFRGIAYGEGVDKMQGKPFRVHFDNDLKGDLQRRLAKTRWGDAVTMDWQYGMDKSFLKALVEYWQTNYNFDAAEERMNVMPQLRTNIAGFGVHYVHFKGRGPRPKPPLLMNGWPSSCCIPRRFRDESLVSYAVGSPQIVQSFHPCLRRRIEQELPDLRGISGAVGEKRDRLIAFVEKRASHREYPPAFDMSYAGASLSLPGQRER